MEDMKQNSTSGDTMMVMEQVAGSYGVPLSALVTLRDEEVERLLGDGEHHDFDIKVRTEAEIRATFHIHRVVEKLRDRLETHKESIHAHIDSVFVEPEKARAAYNTIIDITLNVKNHQEARDRFTRFCFSGDRPAKIIKKAPGETAPLEIDETDSDLAFLNLPSYKWENWCLYCMKSDFDEIRRLHEKLGGYITGE